MFKRKRQRRLRRSLGDHEHLSLLERRIVQANAHFQRKAPSAHLRSFVKTLLRSCSYTLTYELLESAMVRAQEQKPFDYTDFFDLNDAIVWEIYDVLCETKTEYIEACVKTIRFLDSYSFDQFFEKHSYTERILLGAQNGIFAKSDKQTRSLYRTEVLRYAKEHKVSEQAAARQLCEHLQIGREHPVAKRLYFPLLLLSTLTLCVLCGVFTKRVSISLLLFLPLYATVAQLLERIYSRCVPPTPLPRLALTDVPSDAPTLVVITSLLFGKEKDRALFERLEQFWLKNPCSNTMFGLLADLPDSDRANREEDFATLQNAKQEIARLNTTYGTHFCLLVRHRTYNETEGRFMGYERKRGAVLELCRAIAQEPHSFFESELPSDFLASVRYLITLDADTDLSMGAVCHLVATMLHPENRPVLRDGIVVRGHAILQPRMEPSLATCANTPFSVLQCGSGGADLYAGAAFDLYQSVFGEGIFCGKGILDLSCYHALLNHAFPENSVLSHDLLEGSYLRAANLVDFTLTDSCPKTPLADFNRRHRWIRGDIQALPFARHRIRTQTGERIKNPIRPLSRYKLWDNLRRILTPIVSALALTVGLFYPHRAAMLLFSVVLLPYFLPFFFSALDTARHAGRRFFSHVLGGIWHAFLGALYQITTLFTLACVSTDALFRALFRMLISRRHLLQWVTAMENDRQRFSTDAYILRFAPSFLVGFLLLVFSPYGAFHLIGALWCLSPLIAFLVSRPFRQGEKSLSEKEKRELKTYVEAMWSYFSDFVTEEHHHLPPDNYQILPTETVAARTSPTNIGLYLLSVLAARDFDLISTAELTERMEHTVQTLEGLVHWHGHLYNWYDTQTLSLLGTPYISTVDSGNFVCCALTAAQGILEYAFEDEALSALSARLSALADRADFSLLYDSRRHLMVIGYNTATQSYGENHYDFYMSEARTTSYYAIASGMVEQEHWRHLGRPLIAKNHFLGLQSWSGTMFEYFMPSLLLPVYPNSLQSEALHFAYALQATTTARGLYGRSESGYFHFDADMNYQYRAFGVSELALQAGMDRENVLAPYASFLALTISPSAALDNLRRFLELGAFGKYGFYEAVDFTARRVGSDFALVRSFMSHHIGMSMVAAANAVFDNVFVGRFLKDARMNAATELLMEKIPVDAPIYRKRKRAHQPAPPRPIRTLPTYEAEATSDGPPLFSLFTNGKTRLLTTSSGQIGLEHESQKLLRDNLKDASPYHGLRFLVACDGGVYSALAGAYFDRGSYCTYEQRQGEITLRTSLSLLGEIPCMCLHLEAQGSFRKITPTLFFEPILAREADYTAHPAFSKLSIEAEYDADRNLLLFHRRPRTEREKDLYLGLTFLSNTPFDFSTRRDEVLDLCYEAGDLLKLPHKQLKGEVGACIDPVCVAKKTSESEQGRYACDILLFFTHQREQIHSWLGILRAKSTGTGKRFSFFELAQRSLAVCMRNLLNSARLAEAELCYVRLLLCAMHRPMPPIQKDVFSSIGDLWRHGISGDYPIVTLALNEALTNNNLRGIVNGFLHAHRFLALCGVRFDLVFLYDEPDLYLTEQQSELRRLIEACGSDLFLQRKGGIYLLPSEAAPAHLFLRQVFYATLDAYTVFDHLWFRYREDAKSAPAPLPHTATIDPYPADHAFSRSQGAVFGGSMEADRFIVYKGTQRAPWSYLYTDKTFGTLLTQNSLGYTWWKNAREGRLTPFSNDPLTDLQGERLFYTWEGEVYDLCACSNRVEYRRGSACYFGTLFGEPYTVEVGVDSALQVKLIRCHCAHKERITLSLNVILGVYEADARGISRTESASTVFFRSYTSEFFAHAVAYQSQFDDGDFRCFLLGIYEESNAALFDIVWEKYHTAEAFSFAYDRYAQRAQQLCGQITVETGNLLLDRCVNFYIPYQAFYARLFGRSGFYQSGGAFGFRDQLQDSLAALYADSDLTRQQILLAASRQFPEGDVLHWWHEEPHLRGIRTRCSDDLLWLPYVCALYCEAQDSDEILDVMIPYLSAEPLADGEQERYSAVAISSYAEPLYRHCLRAMERACRFGRHGLPLIGSGDWNDGMNRIGEGGQGESVWLGFFLMLVLRKMIPICERRGDAEAAQRYRALSTSLSDSIERYAYDTDHYLRAFFDDGTPIGAVGAPHCAIDLLPQAFAAIVNGPNLHAQTALHTAYNRLYEKEGNLLRLFAPSIPSSEQRYGYISAYVDGVRENGGQYTHAAIWAAWGFLAIGEPKTAFHILKMQCPALRAKSEQADRYRTEPYAIPADIYAAPDHIGRGGWTHYTGSAAWYYRIFLYEMIGYREYGDRFEVHPALCSALPSIKLTLRRHGTVYRVEARMGEVASVRLDGKEAKFPMFFDKKSHFLEIVVENSSDLL